MKENQIRLQEGEKERHMKANRTRNYRIQTWLNEKEYEHFQGIVEKSRLTKENCLRQLIESGIVQTPMPVEYFRFLTELNMIGNNINQIARIANVDRTISPESITECRQQLKRIAEMLRSQLL